MEKLFEQSEQELRLELLKMELLRRKLELFEFAIKRDDSSSRYFTKEKAMEMIFGNNR